MLFIGVFIVKYDADQLLQSIHWHNQNRRILMSALSQRALRLGNRYLSACLLLPRSTYTRRPQVAISALHFSTNKEEKESLQDTINRIKNEGKQPDEQTTTTSDKNDIFRKAADFFGSFQEEVSKTWQDLVQSGGAKDINKKIRPTETVEGAVEYTGPVEIMVINPSENLTAWQRMQKRLTDAPIIQSKFILNAQRNNNQ